MTRTNKRTISIGKLCTMSIWYLSGFFGEVVTREEMGLLQEAAQKAGAKRVNSSAWNLLIRYDTPIPADPVERETFARETVDMAADRMLSGISWRYGRQCRLFMEGYLDGLPEHLSLFDALEMMKKAAPSYFKGSAE